MIKAIKKEEFMKKKFKRGFVLAETVGVSMIVIGALTFVYVQFASITIVYHLNTIMLLNYMLLII